MIQITQEEYDRLTKIEKLAKDYYDKASSNPLVIWNVSFSEAFDFLDKFKELLK